MMNYTLQPNEAVLYQGKVSLEKRNDSVELILTNINLVFVITIKKFLAKAQTVIEAYPVEDIKVYNNTPQIKQKKSKVEIFLSSGEVVLNFESLFEAGKFVKIALCLLTGKTTAERGADKVKSAVGLVDDTLGINTVNTVKNVLENGITGSLLGGIGKKSTSAIRHVTAAKEISGIAKELAGLRVV